MKDYKQIAAGMYVKHSLKQCIGTTAYIQFMENHNKSFGSDHCFKFIMRNTQYGVGVIFRTAFVWSNTRQGYMYWEELASKWERYVIDNGIDGTLSHILKNTERK